MTQNAEGMFVCEGNGALCGWLWMDTKTNFVTQECYVNFRSFYITEDARGSAEAEALLAHGLDYCRQVKARSVVGKVHAGNVSMRALYKKMGFEATHITMEYNFALEKP